jgi:hypothetical protein
MLQHVKKFLPRRRPHMTDSVEKVEVAPTAEFCDAAVEL